MCNNYIIVLFKNRVRKKIIKTFKTSKRSLNYYDKLIKESDQVIFEMSTENGHECKYEIALLEKDSNNLFPTYMTDEYGRNIKIELEDKDYSIVKISPYKKEEFLHDYELRKRISVDFFIKTYLNDLGIKLLSKLNNKIVIQKDNKFNLFSLKSDDDADRFIDRLSEYFITNKKFDTICVKDISTAQRKYLYDLLVDQGFPKSYLYRQVTTFGVEK